MIVFNGFEILEWMAIAFMIVLFVVLTIVVRLREKFRNWKDKKEDEKYGKY